MKIWQLLILTLGFLPVLGSLNAQDTEQLKEEAVAEVEEMRDRIDGMSQKLWDYSETALKETRSAEALIQELEAAGFSLEKGVADMPTAFVATYGSGDPVIGILAEFDALPGIGNQPMPKKVSRDDGVTAGHGCGHNLFGAGAVGGAIALQKMMTENELSGTVKLFGTPAEETVVGKVYMAKAGLFDGLDAVLDWHPGTQTGVKNKPSLAMNNFQVEFFGQSAHGAGDPWNGRSALDAVEMMNYGVNMMREHVRPTTRIHYVIPNAGEAPNVVPDYAKVWYYVRDVRRDQVEEYYQRILKIAEAAAMATQTTHKVNLITGVHSYLHNRPLQEALQANMEMIGPPGYTEDEQQFAKELQAYVDKPQLGYIDTLVELADEIQPVSGGSTDVAEVSRIAPTAGFRVTTAAYGVPWHSWATTACHGTSAGKKGAVIAAKVIAATGIDLLTRPELLAAAKKDFEQSMEDQTYESPLPEDQKPPVEE